MLPNSNPRQNDSPRDDLNLNHRTRSIIILSDTERFATREQPIILNVYRGPDDEIIEIKCSIFSEDYRECAQKEIEKVEKSPPPYIVATQKCGNHITETTRL